MNEFLSAFVSNLLMAFAPVLAAALAAWIIAEVKLAWAQFKAAKPDIADQLEWAARTAVMAAEQAQAGKLAEEKKAYALEVAQQWLAMKGLNVDLTAIDAAIEAAVYDEINRNKLPASAE